jgi:hypothetical protein
MPRIIKSAKGTFNSATVTVDSSGRVIAGESGSGGAVMTPKLAAFGPASGTYTSNGNQMMAYAASGGGGGGGGPQQQGPQAIRGGGGGFGVVGLFTSDITPPFSQPYAVGGGGSAGGRQHDNRANPGSAGGTTSIATLFSLNGGNGGNKAPLNQSGNPGTPGTIGSGTFVHSGPTPNGAQANSFVLAPTRTIAPAPQGSTNTRFGIGEPQDHGLHSQRIFFSADYGLGGPGGNATNAQIGNQHAPRSGGKGALVIFDNA